ncbi:hypothetical protein CKA32_006950 [Geitlerinema sp. FC II]|nr:hypothetical protein CKA32_006950 [Geitlerinema sp. FC II]
MSFGDISISWHDLSTFDTSPNSREGGGRLRSPTWDTLIWNVIFEKSAKRSRSFQACFFDRLHEF